MNKQTYLVCYTEAGESMMRQAEQVLRAVGRQTRCFVKPKGGGFLADCWQSGSEILFVGAAGIAVRLLAPYIQDKFKDPAVVVMDEKGRFVIPILSGHVGGANELAYLLARQLGAAAVITTATDVNECFAVDVFASRNRLVLTDRRKAKEFSAGLLREGTAAFFCEAAVNGDLPRQLKQVEKREDLEQYRLAFLITDRPERREKEERFLQLYPRHLTAGMGCKKGIPAEKLEEFLRQEVEKLGYDIRQIKGLASIDRKGKEPGLCLLAERLSIPFRTWPAGELEQAEGSFHESAFVKQMTGTGNVCERAAILGSRGGRLVLEKTAREGMTLAIAEEEWSVNFDKIICDRPGTGPI